MIKLSTGYYQYKPNTGITFLDTHLYVGELSRDTMLVTPSMFHKIANSDVCDKSNSNTICFFKHNDDFLIDLHFAHNIGGLHDY
jgi:hypothetical protein